MGKLKILGDVVEGGLGMMRNALKAEDAVKELTAAERAAAGRKAAELIKSQPQVKASEALGQMREKGMKRTTTTQADRTRVGGGNIGGAPFSAISEADPNYAGKVWGVMDEGTAARLKNLTDPETAWTTMLGSANQLKTNPIVFDKLKRGFVDSMKQGNLSDELAGKINHNLELTFGAGADIRDPKIWRQADTFEKRAALADVMMGQGTAPSKGGIAIGGEKSGRGVIFQPTDILKRETEPSLLHIEHGGDVPTFAAGPRLFRLEKESEFRPDLHPGFPTLLKGEDLGVNMRPTPTEIYLPDWHAKFKKNNPERKGPGYYDLALGVKGEGLPSQELTDEYIRHLIREGFKKGGAVEDFDAKVDKLIEKHHFDSHIDSKIEQHFAKGGMPKLERTTLRMAGGGTVKPMPKVEVKHTTLRNRGATQAQPNGFKEGGKSEATVQATPRSKGYGAASDLLKEVHEFASKPFGYSNPPVEFISELLGIPAASRVLDKLSYGEPITNYGKANVPFMQDDTFDAAGALLGGLGSMSKLAKPLAKAAKKLPKDIPVGLSIKAVDGIPTGQKIMPTARIGLEAPGILIPSKMNNVREAVRNTKGNYGARRVERAADEIPNLERMFQEDALKEAFTGDNASAMMSINPSDFEKFARELERKTSVGPKAAELAKQGDIDKMTVTTDEYIKHLQRLKDGFSDVPYLNLNKDEVGLPTMPKVIGHEGRHRNRALADAGEKSSLVKINPRGDLREGMPRRTQEDYIEALREELERSNRLVLPETDPWFRRPEIQLPDIYAKGGPILKHTTLRNRRANQRVR